MKKLLLVACLHFFACTLLLAQTTAWHIAGDKITSPWADSVNPSNVLPEYPRPQLVRGNWTNLNGLWQYAILPKDQQTIMPATTQGNILVPFAVESALSGVGKTVGKDSVLWYKRTVTIPAKGGSKTLLHFGAVDWHCDVYVNGTKVGRLAVFARVRKQAFGRFTAGRRCVT